MTTFYTNVAIVKLHVLHKFVCVCLENVFIKQFFSFKAFREIFIFRNKILYKYVYKLCRARELRYLLGILLNKLAKNKYYKKQYYNSNININNIIKTQYFCDIFR